MASNNNHWACHACTYLNPTMFLCCSICDTSQSPGGGGPIVMPPIKTEKKVRKPITANPRLTRLMEIDLKAMRKIDDNGGDKKPAASSSKSGSNNTSPPTDQQISPSDDRIPPEYTTAINNLSDRRYCCVWSVEVFEVGHRPDVARCLLARVARHVNPILRDRGWRVKRLIESASSSWVGLCTTNGRNDADACSTNIQLNLRVKPSKHCKQFRPFRQILAVMLHEITHTSIGLEDIHPPAFYELLEEIKGQYYEKLNNGEVDLETEDYGCQGTIVTESGTVKTIAEASQDILGSNCLDRKTDTGSLLVVAKKSGEEFPQGDECGATKIKKRRRWRRRKGGNSDKYKKGYKSNATPMKRPLLKGTKMVDGRTKQGKALKDDRERLPPRGLALCAALERQNQQEQPPTSQQKNMTKPPAPSVGMNKENFVDLVDNSDSDETVEEESVVRELSSDDEDSLVPHEDKCGCRSCEWDKLLFMPPSLAGKKQERVASMKA